MEVANAIWESDWFEYSDELKKTLALVMLRCQKPLTLSVGPFYHMSTQTALSVSSLNIQSVIKNVPPKNWLKSIMNIFLMLILIDVYHIASV